jgi:hypothetical protein
MTPADFDMLMQQEQLRRGGKNPAVSRIGQPITGQTAPASLQQAIDQAMQGGVSFQDARPRLEELFPAGDPSDPRKDIAAQWAKGMKPKTYWSEDVLHFAGEGIGNLFGASDQQQMPPEVKQRRRDIMDYMLFPKRQAAPATPPQKPAPQRQSRPPSRQNDALMNSLLFGQ